MSPIQWLKSCNHDAISGLLLITAALIAMILANSPWVGLYQGVLSLPVNVSIGSIGIDKPLLLWINDGLMAIFFFLIGLEVKRELLIGRLASKEQVILPAIAAIAGIIVPALVYTAFTYKDDVMLQGWAIPAATDIAFALGIFALFGKHLPTSLKLFLLSVAIFDDIGAILIIALFYSQELSTASLLIAASGLGVLFLLNQKNVQSTAAYVFVGVIVWIAVLKSGVHATLAGFVVAWFIPLTKPDPETRTVHPKSMLETVEHNLHPWVAFFILPLFAFSNAGVNLQNASLDALTNPITLGIALGLVVGKQIGIFSACWLAIKSGIATLPKGSNWVQLYGVTVLCGIGFTMSLFIGTLAFEQQGNLYDSSVKLGVLIGSIISAVIGSLMISYQPKDAAAAQQRRQGNNMSNKGSGVLATDR